MDIYEAATELNKRIEKIEKVLKHGTPLTPAQRQAKEAQVATLKRQIQSLQQYLPTAGVTKVIHKN